jgi:quercetin dioxygenase-like cupin family protein
MPVVRADQGIVHSVHGSIFHSFAAPSRGNTELVRLAGGGSVTTATHTSSARPRRILLVLEGQLMLTLDGTTFSLGSGDTAVVPANGEMCIDGGHARSQVWVTSSVALEAVMVDGTRLTPPWAK